MFIYEKKEKKNNASFGFYEDEDCSFIFSGIYIYIYCA